MPLDVIDNQWDFRQSRTIWSASSTGSISEHISLVWPIVRFPKSVRVTRSPVASCDRCATLMMTFELKWLPTGSDWRTYPLLWNRAALAAA